MSASFATNWTLGEDEKKKEKDSKQKGKRYPVSTKATVGEVPPLSPVRLSQSHE